MKSFKHVLKKKCNYFDDILERGNRSPQANHFGKKNTLPNIDRSIENEIANGYKIVDFCILSYKYLNIIQIHRWGKNWKSVLKRVHFSTEYSIHDVRWYFSKTPFNAFVRAFVFGRLTGFFAGGGGESRTVVICALRTGAIWRTG